MFTSPLIVEEATQDDFWSLAAPLTWGGTPSAPALVVPVGFLTDLASIPRALRNLPAFDPNGKSRKAAVAHDWLYWWKGWGKDRADAFLREAMIAEGCSHVDAEAFYIAVHDFGGSSWADASTQGLESHFNTVEDYKRYLASVTHV